MLTPEELSSKARPFSGSLWRVVEGQAQISTMLITNSLSEQQILEEEIEAVKPQLPPGTEHLHPLLKTPFRYKPYDHGSRFRRAHQREGVYYGAEAVETAIAELAFYRMLFFAEAPGLQLPDRALELTGFSVECAAQAVIDLTCPPLKDEQWTSLTDYSPCQALADVARSAHIDGIRYQSVRDPSQRANVALLTWTAFRTSEPQQLQTWHLFVRRNGIAAIREFPRLTLEFTSDVLGKDPRLSAFFA